MQTVNDTYMCKNEIKKSTFISFITPIEHFEPLHAELKEKHPKARHIVWAKRYLNELSQIVENSSDDGEPKGTSGPPILNVMRGSELIECGILIVRYFGGTKLGTGGLVRAYGGGAKEVIAHATIVAYIKKEPIKFTTDYSLVPRFEHFLEKENIFACKRSYEANGVVWSVDLSEAERKTFLDFATMFERDGFSLEL
jgi:uncharacterized YigZ family protein